MTVFDKGTAGGEASWVGAGMLAPGGEVDAPGEWADNILEARRLYPEFVAELAAESKLTIDFQQNGGLDLAYSQIDLETLEQRRSIQSPIGISSKILTAQQIATFWPRVRREGLKAGAFYPDDALVNPRDITQALIRACRARGVVIAEHTQVNRITVNAAGVSIKGPEGEMPFDNVVIAAGAWSNTIQVSPALPLLPKVAPVKGVLLGYHQPEQTCSTIVRHGHTYLLQRTNGMLIAGASVEYTDFDRQIDPKILNELIANTTHVFPHLGETTPTEVWTGFRPYSDELHMGQWHNSRVYLAYGHYRNGILLAPHTAAKIVSSLHP